MMDSIIDPQPGSTLLAADVVAARRKRKLTHGIILSGWILILMTMVTIMGAALAMTWQGRIVPDMLADWAGIALGFLFGTFATIVKDFIQDAPE